MKIKSSGGLSDEQIEKKLIRLRELGDLVAEAEASRSQLAEAKKAIISIEMIDSPNNTVNAQERDAYASVRFKKWRDGYAAAIEKHLKLKHEMDILKLELDLWRTAESTRRAEMRLI